MASEPQNLLPEIVDILCNCQLMYDDDFRNGFIEEFLSASEKQNVLMDNTKDVRTVIIRSVKLAFDRGKVAPMINAALKREFLSNKDVERLERIKEQWNRVESDPKINLIEEKYIAQEDHTIYEQAMKVGGENMNSETPIDVVIITALKKEKDAVLRYLDSPEEIKTMGRIAYRASISTKKSDSFYNVVLLLTGMGNIRAASATRQAIDIWNPAHIILTGIAAGRKKGISHYLGDIIVAEQIVNYELGKQTETGTKRRYQAYRPASVLLEAAKNLSEQNWALSIHQPRPDVKTGRGIPQVHFGVVMSGEKVIADSSFMDKLQDHWPELIGAEMEGAGAALAAYESGNTPGVLLVKGICDWGDAQKNDIWQEYAADAAASFVVALLKSRPFESKIRPQPLRVDSKPYGGQVKIKVCQRLTNDWADLADYFDISMPHRKRFDQGREPQGVWEWLEDRDKLGALPDALSFIDRDDLVEILNK